MKKSSTDLKLKKSEILFEDNHLIIINKKPGILVQGDIANLVIEPVSEGGKIYKLPIPGNWTDSEQYFLLENRQQTKYDTYLPGEGL